MDSNGLTKPSGDQVRPSVAAGADLRLGDVRLLGAALWTNNLKLLAIWRAALMRARFSSEIVVSGARVLFDGIKKSGYGREPGLSASGIHEHQGAVDRSGVFRNE